MARESVDVAVVGAGPAGMAAEATCAELGLATILFDEQPAAGGQVFRDVTGSPLAPGTILGGDYWAGAAQVSAFAASGVDHVPLASVWAATRRAEGGWDVAVSVGAGGERRAMVVAARVLVLATGAQERPFPIPGWTLPGVLTAGGAQALLKTAGLVPGGHTVLAGTGALLWLLAWQYLEAGVVVDALLDTTPRGRLVRAMRHAPGFAASSYFGKALELVRAVRRQVGIVRHVTALSAEGTHAVERVRFTTPQGAGSLPADQLLLHQGVIPNVNLAAGLGCALRWNDAQACFEPVVDAWGGASLPGVFIAGDGADIAGARAAPARGRVAALAAAHARGRIDGAARDRAAAPHRRALATALRGRGFLDALQRPADAFRMPTGETVVCRCEEVTAAQVIAVARGGCAGPNQAKAFLRCGMGPCQGRSCGVTLIELIARERRVSPAEVGYFRLRFPATPITLDELAAMPASAQARRAVERD
jgi:NADPH-dependent 2,4-dienoyl-CoA reductase/sulfur reductase-like enzyme